MNSFDITGALFTEKSKWTPIEPDPHTDKIKSCMNCLHSSLSPEDFPCKECFSKNHYPFWAYNYKY